MREVGSEGQLIKRTYRIVFNREAVGLWNLCIRGMSRPILQSHVYFIQKGEKYGLNI